MAEKPTYEELEQRIRELEREQEIRQRKEMPRVSSEERYRLLVETVGDLIFTITGGGIFTYISPNCEALLGYRPGDFLGENFEHFVHANDKPLILSVIEDIIREHRESGNTNVTQRLVEFRARRKDGSWKWLEGKNAVLEVSNGTCELVCIARDITEQRQTEEALREREEKYRFLIEESNDIIWTFDIATMRYTYGSNSIERILGYPVEVAIGFTVDDVFPPETKQKVIGAFAKVAAGKTGSDRVLIEAEHRHRDGGRVPMEINAVLHRDHSGRPVSFTGVSRDITDRKQVEKEREKLQAQLRRVQKMEALGTLTGGVAHDFNNILSIIMGYTDLLRNEVPQDSTTRKGLDSIKAASLRARDVIRHLLTFSRKGEETKAATDMGLIVNEALRMMHSTTPSSVEFRESVPEHLPLVNAEPSQIHQVIVNLCKNASDAMTQKGGILKVGLEHVSLSERESVFDPDLSAGDYVKLTVSDTGHGIPPGDLERIFDPYFTRKDVDKGTGLGLSVVLGIVKGHRGGIRVESRMGQGTTFEIFFPVANEITIKSDVKTDDALPTGSEKILLVDDEDAVVSMNRMRLEKIGYKVTGETDPVRALEAFRSHPDRFDLLITDMTMPKMTGDDLSREILNTRSDMKIIICTGYSEKISEETAKSIGIAKYLEKPIEMGTLAASVREVLDN